MLAFLRVRAIESAVSLLVPGQIRRRCVRLAALAAFVALGVLRAHGVRSTLRSAVGDDQRVDGVAGGDAGLEALGLGGGNVGFDVMTVEKYIADDDGLGIGLALDEIVVFHQQVGDAERGVQHPRPRRWQPSGRRGRRRLQRLRRRAHRPLRLRRARVHRLQRTPDR